MLVNAGDASHSGASARDERALHVVHMAAEMAPIAKVKPVPFAVCALYVFGDNQNKGIVTILKLG